MASFFAHGFSTETCVARFESIASRMVHTLPKSSVKTRCELRTLDEVAGGWLVIRPATPEPRPRISECTTKTLAALVVGTTTTAAAPAEAVLAHYREGGLERVREMEGNFSAIVVDRRNGQVLAFSDCLGTRALRFWDDSRGLFLAMHDAALVAAGIPTDVDHASAASGLLCGWSLGARPLLRHCRIVGPDYVLRADRERRELVRDSFLDRTSPLATTDTRGISRIKEELREGLVSTLTRHLEIERPDRIRVALTAGVDTRAALALLRATRLPTELTATTTGAPHSVDARWARNICHTLGIPHELIAPTAPTHESFAQNLELLSYVSNGDTDGKRALSGQQTTAPGGLLLSGLGGEIFRGYYYPYYERSRLMGRAPSASAAGVKSLLMRRAFSDFHRIELDRDLKRRVEERLGESLSGFDAYARDVHGYLDCFYLRERYGVWGAQNSRRLWMRSLAPFHCARAIRLVARLPPPWGNQRIQADIIKAFLPRRLYFLPVNESELLSFHGSGNARFWLRDTTRRVSLLARRVLPLPDSQKSHERVRAELLAGEVFDYLHDLLTARESLALELMQRSTLERILSAHREKVTYAKALGYLATLETWRALVGETQNAQPSTELRVHRLL